MWLSCECELLDWDGSTTTDFTDGLRSSVAVEKGKERDGWRLGFLTVRVQRGVHACQLLLEGCPRARDLRLHASSQTDSGGGSSPPVRHLELRLLLLLLRVHCRLLLLHARCLVRATLLVKLSM